MFRRLLYEVSDFLFPSRCVACRTAGAYLCARCLAALPRARSPQESFIEAIFEYRSAPVRRAIWKLKYSGVRALATLFGAILYERIFALIAEEAEFGKRELHLLIPIPLSRKRLKERGFNHAALIAESLATLDRESTLSYEPAVLQKIRDTKNQMTIRDKAARLANIRGSFGVHTPERVRGKSVILVDDVTTTGATLAEARAALLAAGAKEVRCFALAH